MTSKTHLPKHPFSRRDFLGRLARGAAVGALATAAPAHAARRVSPNEQIGVGIIGTGSLGKGHHLPIVLGHSQLKLLAVCDVDQNHADEAALKSEDRVTVYKDFRALLDRNDIDAVLIATPDHWHALITIHACQAGKDIYCEKPLSLTVEDGRAMVDAVRRYGRVFQTGSQQRSDLRFRWACELTRNQRIGRLKHVQATLPQGPTCGWEPDRNPPPHLDWDLWLGPAPKAPYNPNRCHYNFRWFYDYSGGQLTDWGAHHVDIAQWGMGTDQSGPTEVEGAATFPADGLYESAVSFNINYRYKNGVTLHVTSEGENGVTFFGTEGKIFVSRSTIEADPPEILDTPPGAGPIQLYKSDNHHDNWIACIRTRKKPTCDVETGFCSVTACHLGNIAIRLGRKLKWDPDREVFKGDEAANRLLKKPMRYPWSL